MGSQIDEYPIVVDLEIEVEECTIDNHNLEVLVRDEERERGLQVVTRMLYFSHEIAIVTNNGETRVCIL